MGQKTYTPGVCNIGPAETALRRRIGYIAGVASLALWAALLAAHAPAMVRLVLFLPFTGAAICLIQAAFHFCVGYGFAGLHNLFNAAGTAESVGDQAFRRADRLQALRILAYSIVAGALVTAIAVVL